MNKVNMMHYLPQVEADVVEQKLAELQALHPGLGVCALLPEAEKEKVAVLQAACAKRNVPLVGAIFPALVKDGHFLSGVRFSGRATLHCNTLNACRWIRSRSTSLSCATSLATQTMRPSYRPSSR